MYIHKWKNETYCYSDNVLSNEEISHLEGIIKQEVLKYGETHNDDKVGSYRTSKINFMWDRQKYGMYYDICGKVTSDLNHHFYNFDVEDIEVLQYTEYDSKELGKYDWHTDVGYEYHHNRKLSFVIQLSDPTEYEGGELQFFGGESAPMIAPKTKGTFILFPSTNWHRVTPVTKGIRHSLVGWITGPRFK